jgi:hypothetical protein
VVIALGRVGISHGYTLQHRGGDRNAAAAQKKRRLPASDRRPVERGD